MVVAQKKTKQVTKEEKDRILAELLKPLGPTAQVQKSVKKGPETTNKPKDDPKSSKEDKSFFESKTMMHGDMGNEFLSA